MATTQPYKGYEGTADMDMERQVCRGKILFIDDVVTYEADSPRELQKEFEAAVEDYIETCTHVGKEPQRPLKGQFNVRITPALHRAAALRACQDCVSLNEVVGQALDAYINAGTTEVRHSVRLIVEQSSEAHQTLVSTASAQTAPIWQSVEVSHVHH
jgi:predicted HicB family RNase H-like nuclease